MTIFSWNNFKPNILARTYNLLKAILAITKKRYYILNSIL